MDYQQRIDGSELAVIDNAKQLVEEVMAKYPTTRGNDFELIFRVWELQGVTLPPALRASLLRCYTPETITRARRDIQNNQKILTAPEHVQVGRDKQEKKFHSYYGRR